MAKKADEIRNLYNQTVSHYDERYRSIQFSKFSEISARWNEKDTVLDVGCGTGLLIEYLEIVPTIYVGVDLSFNMLQVVKEKKPWPCCVAGDVRKLPIRKNAFSRIMSFSVLQNIPDPRETIAEILRVSEKPSSLVITALRKTISIMSLVNWVREEAERHGIRMEIEEFNLALEDVGIKCDIKKE